MFYNNIYVQSRCMRRICSFRKMSVSVYVTRKIPTECKLKLKDAGLTLSFWDSDEPVPHETLKKQIKGKNGILCLLTDKLCSETIANAGSQLRVVSTISVGVDHIDTKALKKHNIRLGYTPDVLTDATSELAMALLLATTRRLSQAITAARDGSWGSWKPFWMCGRGLRGSTVGIVGMGRIGRAVAQRCVPFGVSRIVFSRSPGHAVTSEPEMLSGVGAGGSFPAYQVTFDDLLAQADFVLVCCAFTEETRGLFGDKEFSRMKTSSVLVNISRGPVVDQTALQRALETGKIWAAGLDVTSPEPLPTDSPLFRLDNCTILPHIGSANFQTRGEMIDLAVENLIEGLKGPMVPMPAEMKL